jgi:hypothetical protein
MTSCIRREQLNCQEANKISDTIRASLWQIFPAEARAIDEVLANYRIQQFILNVYLRQELRLQ